MVLDSFIKRSGESGVGSPVVEILADTAVALASANVQLVAKKIIGRLCRVSYCYNNYFNDDEFIFLMRHNSSLSVFCVN